MFSGGARESRDSVSGLTVGLNGGIMGWGSTNHDKREMRRRPNHGYVRNVSTKFNHQSCGTHKTPCAGGWHVYVGSTNLKI